MLQSCARSVQEQCREPRNKKGASGRVACVRLKSGRSRGIFIGAPSHENLCENALSPLHTSARLVWGHLVENDLLDRALAGAPQPHKEHARLGQPPIHHGLVHSSGAGAARTLLALGDRPARAALPFQPKMKANFLKII